MDAIIDVLDLLCRTTNAEQQTSKAQVAQVFMTQPHLDECKSSYIFLGAPPPGRGWSAPRRPPHSASRPASHSGLGVRCSFSTPNMSTSVVLESHCEIRSINVSDGLFDGNLYSDEMFSIGSSIDCPSNQFPIVYVLKTVFKITVQTSLVYVG